MSLQENFKFFPPVEIKEMVSYIAAWCVLGLGSIPSQDVFQRAYVIKHSKNRGLVLLLSSIFVPHHCHASAFHKSLY